MEFNSKQKLIIIGICAIMVGVIIFYFYSKFSNSYDDVIEAETEYENEIEEQTEDENDNNEDEDIIIVHIQGAVQKEGIIKIKEGNRIADVIEKAGGLKENASLKNINLAYMVEDGQKIYIPTQEEDKNQEINSDNTQNTVSNKININTATKEQLQALSGIGEATAESIITYRKENGKFQNIEDIKNVSGIGNSKFNKIKDEICIK